MKIEPVGNRVLVNLKKQNSDIGGIIIPDIVEQEINIGEVLALGTGKIVNGKQIPWEVEVGDKVILNNTLDKIKILEGGVEFCVYRQDEIVGVIYE